MDDSVKILGLGVNVGNYDGVVSQIDEWLRDFRGKMICAANVHMVMEFHDSVIFQKIMGFADLVVPDGMPLVWMMKAKGCRQQTRIYGPDVMRRVIAHAEAKSIPIGIYGSESVVTEALVSNIYGDYPRVNIAYTYNPPFRELSIEEDRKLIDTINSSGIRILFVGLGCPKQEFWMAAHKSQINAVMIGVGAAFDFIAGTKAHAPSWMQRIGLEWLFRLLSEPRRLAKRYIIHNPRFVILAVRELLTPAKKTC